MTQYDELQKLLGRLPSKPYKAPVSKATPFVKAIAPKPIPRIGVKPLSPLPPKAIVRLKKPRVFVSFDYENDVHYQRLLGAWSANSRFQFTFQEMTPSEIQSEDVGRVKAVLTAKVKEASHVLVLAGKHANQPHIDARKINCLNWIHFECQQAIINRKKIVVVMLPDGKLPTILNGVDGILVKRFDETAIKTALAR